MRQIKTYRGGTLNVLEKGETANPNGRPRKLVKSLIAELKGEGYEKVTPEDVKSIIEVLLNMSQDELQKYANDKDQPFFIRKIIEAMTTKGLKGFESILVVMDRAHGRPKNVEEINITSPFLALMKAASVEMLEEEELKELPAPKKKTKKIAKKAIKSKKSV